MTIERTKVRTPDGEAECSFVKPQGSGPFPGVIFYIDALGVRPAMQEMAERVAADGYVVLLPNVLYRAGDFAPVNPKTVWTDTAERGRLMAILSQLDVGAATRDAGAWIDSLTSRPEVKPGGVGVMGYCLGGRLAFITAGTRPDQ